MTAAATKGGGTSTATWGNQADLDKQVEEGAAVVENAAI
jgi:hypothetical protein